MRKNAKHCAKSLAIALVVRKAVAVPKAHAVVVLKGQARAVAARKAVDLAVEARKVADPAVEDRKAGAARLEAATTLSDLARRKNVLPPDAGAGCEIGVRVTLFGGVCVEQ